MSLSDIQNRIAAEESRIGRLQGSTRLIAVSKVQPNDRVEAVLQQGHRIFGENRVQEAAGKWPEFRSKYDGVELHLLGPLQTNKTRQAMELFDYIHTLDRLKLANRIAAMRDDLGHCPKLFIQVNTGRPRLSPTVVVEFKQQVTTIFVYLYSVLSKQGLYSIDPSLYVF